MTAQPPLLACRIQTQTTALWDWLRKWALNCWMKTRYRSPAPATWRLRQQDIQRWLKPAKCGISAAPSSAIFVSAVSCLSQRSRILLCGCGFRAGSPSENFSTCSYATAFSAFSSCCPCHRQRPGNRLLQCPHFTGDRLHPYAEAVAIRGKYIVAVGNTADLRKHQQNASWVDLQGGF